MIFGAVPAESEPVDTVAVEQSDDELEVGFESLLGGRKNEGLIDLADRKTLIIVGGDVR